MAYYAFIDLDGFVTEVIAGNDASDVSHGVDSWEQWYSDFREQKCLATSFGTFGGVHYTNGEVSADQTKSFRKNYAGIGWLYDEARDAFVPPAPYPTWILNNDTCQWDAPVPKPDGEYRWNETENNWEEVQDGTE
jgi:hypothetical protein